MIAFPELPADEYPQLWPDPDSDTVEAYRRVVLRGEEPEANNIQRLIDTCQNAEPFDLITMLMKCGIEHRI